MTTDNNGDWSAVVPVGSVTSDIDFNDPDFPVGSIQTEGTNPTTSTVTASSSFTEVSDGFFIQNVVLATVDGHLYFDTNGNGTQDAGEPDLANVAVGVIDALGGTQLLTTDANGDWSTQVPEGSTITAINENDPNFPTGATQTEGTNPTVVNVIAGNNNSQIDGYTDLNNGTANLSGHLYYDTNGNGTQDAGEPNLSNVDVEITNSFGALSVIQTDINGDWSIVVPQGNTVSEIDQNDPDFPTGATQTEGTDPTTTNVTSNIVEVSDGFYNANLATETVSGHLYYDSNGDGTQNSGEPDLANVDVEVANSLGIAVTLATDNNGNWSLLVPVGNTVTTIDVTDPDFPTGATQTEGTNPTTINVNVSGANSEIDGFYNSNLETGDLSGHIYYDTNGNATQDPGEPNLANIPVLVTDAFGATYNLFSDANGDWLISVPTGNTNSLIDVNDPNFPIGATQTEGTNPTVTNVTANSSNQELDGFTYQNLGVGDLNGHLYYDIDGNGAQDVGEPNLPNVDVTLNLSVGISLTLVTDANGDWSATVPEGTTTSLIDENDPDFIIGATQTEGTNPTSHNIIAGTITDEIDGYTMPVTNLAELSGHIYVDSNANGVQDSGEPNLADIDVLITDFLGGTQVVSSDINGDWIASVVPGQTVSDIDESDPDFPNTYIQTEGTDPTTTNVVLGTPSIEFDGFFVPEFSTSSLNGHIYFDTDGNGVQDVGEISLSNVQVEVEDDLGLIQIVISDANGDWSAGVAPGDASSDVLIHSIPAFSNVSQSEGTNPTLTTVALGQDYFETDGYYIEEVAPNQLEVFNAISPNGDGQNDYMIIEGIENFPDNKLMIFNRWGTKVYDVSGYGQNDKYFRGYSEGRVTVKQDAKLPAGTYFYILEVKSDSGEVLNSDGYLYIN